MARGCTSIRRYARPHEPAGRCKICRSWRAGFLVGMGATTADTIFLAVSVAAHSAVVSIQGWVPFIALLGAGLMAYFAWNTVRALRRAADIVESKPEEHAKSYATGLSVNITSPYPILWWLTAGLVLIDQLGPAVLVGFFSGLLLWISVFPLALREAQRRIARTYQAVLVFSIVCLAAFAAWLVSLRGGPQPQTTRARRRRQRGTRSRTRGPLDTCARCGVGPRAGRAGRPKSRGGGPRRIRPRLRDRVGRSRRGRR